MQNRRGRGGTSFSPIAHQLPRSTSPTKRFRVLTDRDTSLLQERFMNRLAIATMLGLLAHAIPSSAQEDPRWADAEARFADAESEYERGNYEGALAEFTHIYELLETHERRFFVLFNIGRCQERLFRYADALRNYRQFLEEGRAYTRARGEQLEREAEAAGLLRTLPNRLGTLEISANVGRAEVWVDQRLVGSAPGEIVVAEGTHSVELRAYGHAPARQQVTIAGRTREHRRFTLESSFAGLSPAFFISTAALTVVTAGVGLGFGGAALSEQSSIDEQLASSDPAERFRVTQARIDANADTALIADILLGSAAVLGVVAIVLIFVTDWGAASGDSVIALPWVDPNGGGLAMRGRF